MPQLVARELTCHYAPVDPRLTVRADGEKLQQILLNLLSNAIKYTPSSGRISLSAVVDGESVLIDVRDTGRGIASEQTRADLCSVRAGGHGLLSRDRGHGARASHQSGPGAKDGWRPHGTEHARRGVDVYSAASERAALTRHADLWADETFRYRSAILRVL